MGILTNWFRPAWKHSDAEVRLQSVQSMDAGRVDLLAELAVQDADPRVRAAAAGKIDDPKRLQTLADRGDDAVRRIAKERLSGAADRLLRSGSWDSAGSLLDRITDQKSLVDLSLHAVDSEIRRRSLARLLGLAQAGSGLLETIAVQDATGELGLQVISRLERRHLKDVARKAKHERVRAAASARVTELDQVERKPSAEARRVERLRKLEGLTERALRLAVSSDWPRAESERSAIAAELAGIQQTYTDLAADPAADQATARITRGIREFASRRQQAEEAEREAAQRVAAERAELLAAVGGDIDRERASSIANRWRVLAESAPPVTPADEAVLAAALDRIRVPVAVAGPTAEPVVPDLPEALQSRFDALAAEAEQLTSSRERRDAKHRFQVLHKELDTALASAPPRHPAALGANARFHAAYNAFKDAGRAQREARDQRRGEQTATAEQLIAEATRLAGEPPTESAIPARIDALKHLQNRFRAALAGLRPDQTSRLRELMQPAMDAAWLPLKAHQEAEDWERFQHLAKAEALIAKLEGLLNPAANEAGKDPAPPELPLAAPGEIQPAADAQAPVPVDLPPAAAAAAAPSPVEPTVLLRNLKAAQKAWKELGPLPRGRAQSARQRFKAACDAGYARLQPWFAEQDASRAANLERKQALIYEAETLAAAKPVGLIGSPADLQRRRQAVERMKVMQLEWRKVGPAPREHDEALWERWKTAGDAFWGKHKADLATRDESFAENLKRKEKLIADAEQLAQVSENAKASGIVTAHDVIRRLKDLQQQWKDIGHVPRDQVETTWQRWRAALDRAYATVKSHTDAIVAERERNKQQKEALIAEAESVGTNENARWFKDEIRELIRKWRDIGPVPREAEDELEIRFRSACDKVMKADRSAAAAINA
ncbi:hypothetical protein LBMAG53_27170 [Planctomycetota bacterium]|nr:hypothetical protein LBMAG53_27170 [Planctomycetota bacterium]